MASDTPGDDNYTFFNVQVHGLAGTLHQLKVLPVSVISKELKRQLKLTNKSAARTAEGKPFEPATTFLEAELVEGSHIYILSKSSVVRTTPLLLTHSP